MALISWRDCSRSFGLCVLPILLAWSNAAGQGLTTGGLQGVVEDAAGAPLADVLVTLKDAGSGLGRLHTTNRSGRFAFNQLAPGDYELVVERGGFKPVRMTNIPVRPGRHSGLTVTLRTAAGDVTDQEVIAYTGGAEAQPHVGPWFSRAQLAQTPFRFRELTEVLGLTSLASAQTASIDGLPASMLGHAIDGVVLRRAVTPGISSFPLTALPLSSFEAAELLGNAIDVEHSGFAGPVLNGYSRRGARNWQPSFFGRVTGNASGEGLEDIDRPSDMQLAAVLGGPVSDSSNLVLGVEFRRYDSPFAAPWSFAGEAADATFDAAADQDLDLTSYRTSGLARTDAISAFARGEWQLSQRHRLETRASFGTAPHVANPIQLAQPFSWGSQAEATTLVASAAMLSVFDAYIANEFRVSVVSDQVDTQPQSDDLFLSDVAIPFTLVADNDLRFGGSAATVSESGRRQISVSDALTYSSGAHQIKIGFAGGFGSIEQTRFFGAQPQALFGNAAGLTARQGLLVQPVGVPGTAEFSVTQIGAFLQDTWRPASGVEVVAGVRYDREMIPLDDLRFDAEWLRLTDLSNANAPETVSKVSPRFALNWRPDNGGWAIGLGGGIYYSEADVDAIASAVGSSGRVARRFGSIPQWLAALPTDTFGTGRTLTILSRSFDAPKSVRGSVGITRSLGTQLSVYAAANYRETSNLTRYVDLNRWADAVGEDQDGRPVFGELVQRGALLLADPASNRRFDGYDQVLGVNTDGKSEYTAITLGAEHFSARGVTISANYTYSRTEDDLLSAGITGAPLTPSGILTPQGSEWEAGRSDFDVPHRLVLAADVPLPAGIRVGAVYRYETGLPFTPGLGAGVDLNGDGVYGNDPAFVSDDISGTDALIEKFDCLRSQIGRFAERNSCRMDAVQTLDLRLSARVINTRSGALELVVDAFNLLQSDIGLVDRALYRVDSGGVLTSNGSTFTVPLIVNPNFGAIQQRASLPRLLRIGAQFNW